MTGPRVEFRPTSMEQADELAAYAEVKGHKNLSAYALYSAITMMGKNPLTKAQRGTSRQDHRRAPESPSAVQLTR